MREITQGDLRLAARVLLGRSEGAWPALMAEMLAEAHHADRYRKVFGRVHPRFGNGTLMAVAFARAPVPEPPAGDMRYLEALRAVIEAVLAWRLR